MRLHDRPFVPPTCPVQQEGYIPDLSALPCELHVGHAGDPPAEPGETEIFINFGVADKHFQYTTYVGTDSLLVPADSAYARKAHAIIAEPDLTEDYEIASSRTNPLVEAMRLALCERVANCRGIVDGACWALGAQAMKDVINLVK